jgi:Ala-tRNA(Pro) deacylase
MPFDCDYLMNRFKELGLTTTTVEHPPLRTVEEAQRLRGDLPGGHVKNLFLKDKQKRYWLIVVEEDASVDLKALASQLEAVKFSFASAEELNQILGIIPGAVSPLAAINDVEGKVTVVLDKRLAAVSPLNFHPLRNDRTTAISVEDFLTFLKAIDHPPLLSSIPAREEVKVG